MMIDGKRKPGFEVWRHKGKLFLMMLVNSRLPLHRPAHPIRSWGWWHIPFQGGGKMAMTGPKFSQCRTVPWRKLSPEVQAKVKRCIAYIERHGTPIENDESVFSY